MVKSATAKDLHLHAGDLLSQISKGHEIIIHYRGKPFARLTPLSSPSTPTELMEDESIFGLWKHRKDLKNTTQWIDRRRAPRYPR